MWVIVKIHKIVNLHVDRMFYYEVTHLWIKWQTDCLRNIQLQTSIDLEEVKEKAAYKLQLIIYFTEHFCSTFMDWNRLPAYPSLNGPPISMPPLLQTYN